MLDPTPLAAVNPLQGTDSDEDFSRGNCLPIVALPWGMAHWSLQTNEGPWFFHARAHKLQGLRLTHQPSPWMGDYVHDPDAADGPAGRTRVGSLLGLPAR